MSVHYVEGPEDFQKAVKDIFNRFDIMIEDINAEVSRMFAGCLLDGLGKAVEGAPIESGDMRGSGFIRINGEDYASVTATSNPSDFTIHTKGQAPVSTTLEGEIGFVGPYVRRQHEDLSLRHDRTDGYRIMTGKYQGMTVNMVAGGRAKFLELAVLENLSLWRRKMKEATRRGIKGGG